MDTTGWSFHQVDPFDHCSEASLHTSLEADVQFGKRGISNDVNAAVNGRCFWMLGPQVSPARINCCRTPQRAKKVNRPILGIWMELVIWIEISGMLGWQRASLIAFLLHSYAHTVLHSTLYHQAEGKGEVTRGGHTITQLPLGSGELRWVGRFQLQYLGQVTRLRGREVAELANQLFLGGLHWFGQNLGLL